MELALSLGDTPKPFSTHVTEKPQKIDLGFCMALGKDAEKNISEGQIRDFSPSSDPPVQLNLLPFSPVHRTQPNKISFPWLTNKLVTEPGIRGEEAEGGGANSSPNSSSAVSSFQMDFSIFRKRKDFDGIFGNSNINNVVSNEVEVDRGGGSSRGSDDEDMNGLSRKKLRLTKDQSAFLEESFKEHNTLNPKQKLALAKQLNLRPRQVEVWFQNRRARTKLKQTEVDCEYLKRCCETLTEENRRLQKELGELRALKASQPFYRQLPPTTLTMCPSCERVVTTSTSNSTTTNAAGGAANSPTKLL